MAEFRLGRIKFVYQGNWTTGTGYVPDDVVTVGGRSYICVLAHTASATFVTDLSTKWNLISSGSQWKGEWANGTYYNAGDVVHYGAKSYICNTAHQSASSTATLTATGFTVGSGTATITFATQVVQPFLVGSTITLAGFSPTSTSGSVNTINTTFTVVTCTTTQLTFALTGTYTNSVLGTVAGTSQLGLEQNASSWDDYVTSFSYVGNWASNTRYKQGDVVTYGANTYICSSSHVSSTSINLTKFSVFSKGVQYANVFDGGGTVTYHIGDIVTYGGNTYVAIADNYNATSQTSPNNASYWQVFTQGFKFSGDWNSSTTYLIGSIVRQGGYTYVATADSTNQIPPNASYWAQLNSGLRWTNNPQTYTAVSGTNIVGTGSSATFNVTRTNTVYTVTKNAGGSGYNINDTIKILGTTVGGVSPTNDIIITVSGVTSNSIDTITSTGNSSTWTSGTSYILGDITFWGANSYICVNAHTASTGNRPDADVTGTYWNVFVFGAESAVLTTQGDMFYYGSSGSTRLPIGAEGQLLRATNGYPTWSTYGQINNVIYVATTGSDTVGYGNSIDMPLKTVRYACKLVEDGYLYPSATALIVKNKQFALKEIQNYVKTRYSVNVTGTATTVVTVGGSSTSSRTDTTCLYQGMPISFTNSSGNIQAGTTYWVAQVLSGTTFTIATSYANATAGTPVLFTVGTGTANVGTYVYSASKTERDAGYIFDALVYDLSHGGTQQTTANTLAYLTSTGYISGVYSYDITPFVAALTYLYGTLMPAIMQNQAPSTNYQVAQGISSGNQAIQIIDNSLTLEGGSLIQINGGLGPIVTNGLLGGTSSAVPTAIQPNTTINIKTGTYNEILPIVLPKNTAVVGDELRSTVIQPAPAIANLVNDKPKSINSMLRIRDLLGNLISNTTITPTSGNTQTQVTTLPTGDVGSSTACHSIVNNTALMQNIIINGLTAVPAFTFTNPTGYNTSYLIGYGDAKAQIVNNYAFIINDVSQYFATGNSGAYTSVWNALGSTGQANFKLQVQYILDAVQYDLTYGGNTQSQIVGSSFWSYGTPLLTSAQTSAYAVGNQAVLAFLKSEIANIIIQGAVTPQSGNPLSQVVSGSAGSAGASTFAQGLITNIINWVNNGVGDTTNAPTTSIALASSDLQTAYNALIAKQTEIQSDTLSWVQKYYQNLTFKTDICYRDAGLIVQALAYDLALGSNFASVIAGKQYYNSQVFGNTAASNVTANQSSAEVGSIGFLGSKSRLIAASGAVVGARQIIDDVISSIYGTVTTTASAVTTSTNLITVATNANMVVGMPISFNNLPATITTTATAISSNTITLGATVSSLGIVANQIIQFSGNVFGGIVANTNYYIKSPSSNTIQISKTLGGVAVTLTNVATGSMSVTVNAAGGLQSAKTYWINSITAGTYPAAGTSITITDVFPGAYNFPGTNFVITNTVTGLSLNTTAGVSSAQVNGTVSYNNVLSTIKGVEIIRANTNFLAYEAAKYTNLSYGGTVASVVSTNTITTSGAHNFTVGDPVVFTGTVGSSGIVQGTQYYVLTTPSTTTFTITATQNSGVVQTLTNATLGSLTVAYSYNLAKCVRDAQEFIKGIIYDLQFTGNYKSQRAATLYLNAVNGSLLSNMFLVRNGTGVRNMTTSGLTGSLSASNIYGTKRPTAGAYVSLDPGFGPNDSNAWVSSRSCYVQNVTTFGSGCVGCKIDGALHNGGNKSIVSNDFTQVLSDGIGVWCTGSGSLTELVSVFSYYNYSGYLAELGGRIRATNGNSSYGTYGVVAEGTDSYETPTIGTLNNRYYQTQITNVVTDGTNSILRFEFGNAGNSYSNTVHTISGAGSGYGAVAVADEFRDATVFETRIIDKNDGTGVGGTNYVTVSNAGQGNSTIQGGPVGQFVISATDLALSNAYAGMRLQLTAGTGAGQYANILANSNGSKILQIYKDSFTPLTITATTQGTPSTVTVASTATLYANMPFYVVSAVGGLSTLTVYYVASVLTGTTFSVTDSSGGTAFTSSMSTTTSQSVAMYAAGWDHVIPGYTTVNTTDLTTNYIIEPRVSYTAPGYRANARTLSGAGNLWQAVTYGAGNYVAVSSGSTAASYSTNGTTWSATGALTGSATGWADVTYFGGQKAKATATVGGLGGSGATFSATLGTGLTAGQVVSVKVLTPGYNYTTPPTIVFTPTNGGSGATATAQVLNGQIISVTVANGASGSGYNSAPTVTAYTGALTSVTMNNWGINYNNTSKVTVTVDFPAGLTPSSWIASATATLNSYYYVPSTGLIYKATTGGTFGTVAPTHTSGSANNNNVTLLYVATQAILTPTYTNNGISSLAITVAGYGYTTTPTVTIVDTSAYFVAISGDSTSVALNTVASLAATWTAGASCQITNAKSIATGNGYLVAVGGASGTASAASSTDPTTATGQWVSRSGAITALGAGYYTGVAYGAGTFIAVANGSSVTSVTTNTVTWTAGAVLPGSMTTAVSIAYGNGRFVVIGSDGKTAYSLNFGTTWTAGVSNGILAQLSSSYTWTKVAYGEGLFMAIANGSVWATSPDGVNWTTQAAPSSSNWKGLAFGNPTVETSVGASPRFVAVSNTSGTIAASIRTGAKSIGRVKVTSGVVTEVRMVEPGSGYPKGSITATTASTNIITVSDTTNLVDSQPIEFTGLDSYGLFSNITYYVIGSTIVTDTSFKVSATAGSSTPMTLSTGTGLAGTYRAGPIATVTDSNKLIAVNTRVRLGDGSLANPSFSNRGTGNTTATATTLGDGYSDLFQASQYINISNLFSVPAAGSNIQFGTIYPGTAWTPSTYVSVGSQLIATTAVTLNNVTTYTYNVYTVTISGTTGTTAPSFVSGSASDGTATLTYVGTNPNTWYKLVQVTNVLGVAGNYTAQFQINPALTTYNAPIHGTTLTTRLKYSQVRLTGHDFLYIGTGNFNSTNYPYVVAANAIITNQQISNGGGRVFFTSTDQDGNFNVGNLFSVAQATGTATLNANAFNLTGLQSLQLGGISLGVGNAVITQFSTDPYFTSNSDAVVPTQKAIRSYITAQIGGGLSTLNVNTITAGQIYIANNTITNTLGYQILVTAKMNFTGGIDGAPVALGFFLQR
jgi:hypothetical protein